MTHFEDAHDRYNREANNSDNANNSGANGYKVPNAVYWSQREALYLSFLVHRKFIRTENFYPN